MRSKALFFGFLLFVWGKAGAEPYLAAWKGVNCNACHVNQTGGWLRSDFGKGYGSSLATFDWEGLEDAAHSAQKAMPTGLSVGLDLHEAYYGTFFSAPTVNTNGFLSSAGYAPGRQAVELSVRANQDLAGVMTYRYDDSKVSEFYALWSGLPEGGYLKLGKFMTPYGLGLADDNSFVRGSLNTQFTFDSNPAEGLEFGIYPDPAFVNLSVFNGDLTTNEKGFSGKGGVGGKDWLIGLSVFGQNMDLPSRSFRYGTYGWGKLGPVVLLGEYDRGYDGVGDGQNNVRAWHLSAEGDLGFDCYLRLATEWFGDQEWVNGNDGYRHVISFRCYPVHNLKFQLDLTRIAPASTTFSYTAMGPTQDLVVADAFFFY